MPRRDSLELPKTVIIYYEDGSILKVPYIDDEGLKAFLSLECSKDIRKTEITTYTGE